jgi:hypothetical protein
MRKAKGESDEGEGVEREKREKLMEKSRATLYRGWSGAQEEECS